MNAFFQFIQQLGASSADIIWFPLLIWTTVASIIFFILRLRPSLNPLFQYHIRVATLLALPLGLCSALFIQVLSSIETSTSALSSAFFVIENPLPAISVSFADATSNSINWFNINFLIGLFSFLIGVVAVIMVVRLIISYTQLKKLHKNLSIEPLDNTAFNYGLKDGSVYVAFHDHPLVPFTFGWKHPIIVLPDSIENDPQKLDMAIQHELVHIRRSDYLLQLVISIIQSLFWFHPLIHIGTKEIETFREISCDQEVLNTSDINPKNYANLLLELIPLGKSYDNFTVSMAVKQSTLKQRIETMKHHKMHKTSYKRSLLLLLSITLLIVAPIACSDLRGPENLSDEEILKEEMTIEDFTVDINGIKTLDLTKDKLKVSTQGTGALTISPKNYGVFKFSLRSFDGARLVGSINGNIADFTLNELSVTITSTSQILKNNERAELWVRHYPTVETSSIASSMADPNLTAPSAIVNTEDEEVFIVVESMPELQGGQAGIQSKVEYPQKAIDEGIEGRVTIQFIVDENGEVVNPKVIRGIGGGCDEEALRVVSNAKFTPGVQRGRNVAVQMALPIVFKLNDSDYRQSSVKISSHSSENSVPPPPPPIRIETIESSNGIVKVRLSSGSGPLVGANVSVKGMTKASSTNSEGIATITGLEKGTYTFVFSYIGFGKPVKEITVN